MNPRRALRWLAALSLATALISVLLAVAWTREHARAECWKATAEEDQAQPEGDCR